MIVPFNSPTRRTEPEATSGPEFATVTVTSRPSSLTTMLIGTARPDVAAMETS